MTIAKVVHEGGLTAHSVPESREIHARHQLRPILAIEARPTGDLDLLLSGVGTVLNILVSTLYSPPITDGRLLLKTFALAYDVGAALHHCVNLAKTYESIVNSYQRIRAIPGFATSDSEFATFGYQQEPYYELDALLSAGRRAYDKIGHYVWHAFEGAGGGMPDNMAELVARLRSCPPPLAERLRNSWLAVGVRLKDYRDCTQHFASVDIGLGSGTVMMKRLADPVWKAWARIPDNPEVRSRKKFTYALGLDALTYSWEVANEVVRWQQRSSQRLPRSPQLKVHEYGNDLPRLHPTPLRPLTHLQRRG
jgi:hypothetical protein